MHVHGCTHAHVGMGEEVQPQFVKDLKFHEIK